MGRAPCCEKVGLKKGRWTAEEDEILRKYIHAHGEGSWRSLPKNAGLLRCGKSCRLRWVNYLRDDLRRGNISAEEEDIIIKLHASLGNRWSLISEHLPGRTDNDIKNYWNCHLSRKIHIFNRARNDILPVLMDFAKVGDGCKGKGGHTNRSAAMKNCKTTSIVKMTIKKPEGGGGTGVIRPIIEKETLKGGIDGKDGERQKMVLDPCQYQNCREGMVGISEENPSQGGESESVVFSSKEEREAGILRSCEGQDSRVVCPYDIMNNSENGMSSLTKELENWGNSPNGEGSGILSSNGESGDQWYSSSSMTSCFEDKWADWDWEGVHNLWEVGTEEILSRLWESDVNE